MGDFSSYLLNYRRLTDRASRVKDFEESLFKDWLSASSRGRSGQRTGKYSMELELVGILPIQDQVFHWPRTVLRVTLRA